jgi:hypothetical protein
MEHRACLGSVFVLATEDVDAGQSDDDGLGGDAMPRDCDAEGIDSCVNNIDWKAKLLKERRFETDVV